MRCRRLMGPASGAGAGRSAGRRTDSEGGGVVCFDGDSVRLWVWICIIKTQMLYLLLLLINLSFGVCRSTVPPTGRDSFTPDNWSLP
jgi:hypothetical protein